MTIYFVFGIIVLLPGTSLCYGDNQPPFKFKGQYIYQENFTDGYSFQDVTDIAVNSEMGHVLILQRSIPSLTIWDRNGSFIFAWNTSELGYPHSISLNGSDPLTANVWITDMAGALAAGTTYGHCIKDFSYFGEYRRSIGVCGQYTNGSSLNPIQFDKVTDIAWNSKGCVFIADGDLGGQNNHITVLNSSYELINTWNVNNKPGTGPGEFNLPHTIVIDKCDRVWITDSLNSRIQVFDEKGTFLGEMNCFEDDLVYGLSFISDENEDAIVTTTRSLDNAVGLTVIPINMDCSAMKDIGNCKPSRKFSLSTEAEAIGSSMLHSVTVDIVTSDIYLTRLPGNFPPYKYFPAVYPPVSMSQREGCTPSPPNLPLEWNATILLTPYTNSDMMTGNVAYSSYNQAMLVRLQGPSRLNASLEVLNVESETYVIERSAGGWIKSCSGPYDWGWITPLPGWLSDRKCECKGALNSAGINTLLWHCPLRGWLWFDAVEKRPWRIFLNDKTNPFGIPVMGNFAMISFVSYGTDTTQLKDAFEFCTSPKNDRTGHFQVSTRDDTPTLVPGFSYKCQSEKSLRKWPTNFYLTATMIPVGNNEPLPAQVIYDWNLESQNTMIFSASSTTTAYLIKNETFIINQSTDKEKESCSHLDFGPPNPRWMFQDNCTCMGVVTNAMLSPWPLTVIAVCPFQDDRVFWTWFGSEKGSYNPVIFLETLSPPHEGTNLAFADYHAFYSNLVLIDTLQFKSPQEECN